VLRGKSFWIGLISGSFRHSFIFIIFIMLATIYRVLWRAIATVLNGATVVGGKAGIEKIIFPNSKQNNNNNNNNNKNNDERKSYSGVEWGGGEEMCQQPKVKGFDNPHSFQIENDFRQSGTNLSVKGYVGL